MDPESAAIAEAAKAEQVRVESLFESAASRCAAAPDLDKKAFGNLVRKVRLRGGGTLSIAQ